MEKSKLYRHNSFIYAQINVKISDTEEVQVVFENGVQFPVRRNGFLVTTDEKLQAALERHPAYGKTKSFSLEAINGKVLEQQVDDRDEKAKMQHIINELNEAVAHRDNKINELLRENEVLKIKLGEAVDIGLSKQAEQEEEEIPEPAEVVDSAPETPTESLNFKTIQELKELLVSQHGIPANTLANPKAVEKRAAELGIVYTIG